MPTGTISADIDVAVARDDTELARATMRRVSVRILPLIFILYVCNFLDRTNIAMASLQMNVDLRLSGRAYAFGVGIFFLGDVVFEVPCNVILAKVGARRWIARRWCCSPSVFIARSQSRVGRLPRLLRCARPEDSGDERLSYGKSS